MSRPRVTLERFEHGRDAHECRRLARYGLRLAPRAGRWVALRGPGFGSVVEARGALAHGADQHSSTASAYPGAGHYRIRKADGALWRDSYLVSLGRMTILCADGREIPYVGAAAT